METRKQAVPEAAERRLLRPGEFAEMIGVSKRRAQNLLSARRIPGQIRVPGVGWRVNYSLFLKLCNENAVIPKWDPRAVNV